MITRKQCEEIIDATMQDCPLPPVVDMLMAIGPNDDEVGIMLDFIKSHYTREQMRSGIDEYLVHIKHMRQLFRNRR